MSKADADEVSKSLYMLANGIGKQRSTANGTAKALNTWRVSVLSNGEESIEAHLIKAGIVAKPGELVRFLQLPIFGQHGAFEHLHDSENGRAFSGLLAQNAGKYYGTAGELATEYQITGWPERAAIDAALQCFEQWRNHRGKGELEPKQLEDSVRRYVELYGDARFTNINDDTRLHGERSGYWQHLLAAVHDRCGKL